MDDLSHYIDRAESVMKEMQGLADDLKVIMAEAKEDEYDPTTIKKIARVRMRNDAKKLARTIAALEEYGEAAGLQLRMNFSPSQRAMAAKIAEVKTA